MNLNWGYVAATIVLVAGLWMLFKMPVPSFFFDPNQGNAFALIVIAIIIWAITMALQRNASKNTLL